MASRQLRSIGRNARILRDYNERGLTLASIARREGISRERVRQIVHNIKPARAISNAACWIYVARCVDFVKIGVAKEPRVRVANLQYSNPYPVVLLATRRGGRPEEHEIHRALAAFARPAEWFEYTDVVHQYLVGVGFALPPI